MSTPRVFVLSAGDPTGINFCRSLRAVSGGYHIVASDTNVYRLHLAIGDEKVLLPDANSPAYLGDLRGALERTGADFLHASDTNQELSLVSQFRDELPVTTFLPSRDAVDLYEDKWRTYCCFQRAGIAVPETILVEDEHQLRTVLRAFGRVWLRATHGSGGRGALATDDFELARGWIHRFEGWGKFTAARVLTRRMATWSALWWQGELVAAQARERLHWEYAALSPSGVTGITGAQATTSDATLLATARAAVRSTEKVPHGIVSVDLTYDDEGRPNPTEIQACRFYSSIHFLTAAGLNLPATYVDLGLGLRPPAFLGDSTLPEGLMWLKAVDCEPILTSTQNVETARRAWSGPA
jgi:hypothetical protein